MFNIGEGYDNVLSMSFPPITRRNYMDMAIIKHINTSGVPKVLAILDTFHDEGSSLRSITRRLLQAMEEDYTSLITGLKQSLPTQIEEMVDAITVIEAELREYAEENKMDQFFFM